MPSSMNRGHTLLELLVVVLVLVLGMTLAMSVGSWAVEKGRQAKCAGNLRSIGGMVAAWAADNNGQIVPGSLGRTWPHLLAQKIMGANITADNMRFDVFYCPTLNAKGCNGDSLPTTHYWTNYCGNSQVMGFGSSTYPFRRLSEFSRPSRVGIVWDASILVAGPPNRSSMAASYYHVMAGNAGQSVGWVHGSKEPLLRRHGIANVLFLDGHVESQGDPGDGNYLDMARRGTLIWE